ncbi:MAG TPA: hypothetical protein VN824_20720 [Puia sp.]|nr:hypothetical protein [Puia sp.]
MKNCSFRHSVLQITLVLCVLGSLLLSTISSDAQRPIDETLFQDKYASAAELLSCA